MDYVDSSVDDPPGKRKQPPQPLVEGWQAERWGLPEAGGQLDQPAGLILQMTHALNVYRQWSSYRAARNPVAYRRGLNPQEARFIEDILRAKLERDSG